MRHGWKGRLAGAVVASLTAAAVAVPMASADIDTTPAWDGTSGIGYFGMITPTFGQTVTGTGETLTGFTVYMGDGPVVSFQGGVGVWDGSAVSGVLWSGPDQQTSGGGGFESVSFAIPDGVTLSPGQAYVLYATNLGAGPESNRWGSVDGTTYADGNFVFQFRRRGGASVTDEWQGNWPWADLALQARFAKAVGVVFVPLPARGGFCTVEGNTDPFTGARLVPGSFVNLELAQVTSDRSYAGVVPAIYVEGKGLTCDPPPAGFTQQGLAGDAQQVASGMYPLYAAPKA